MFVLLFALTLPAVSASNSTTPDSSLFNQFDSFVNNTGIAAGHEIDQPSPLVNGTDESGVASRDLLINEVEVNPNGTDIGGEWIELYNPGAGAVNISSYQINTSKSIAIELPSEIVEAGGTYLVVLGWQTLSNVAEVLFLVNVTSGTLVDRTPAFVDIYDDGRTWQRMPDGNNEWEFTNSSRDNFNDPSAVGQTSTAAASTTTEGPECLGSAGCTEAVAIRIVDGDTLYVAVNSTIYKIDLAITRAPTPGEEGFIQSTAFTRNLCLGGAVLVDQDDKQLTSEDGSIIAEVYCASSSLNEELLENGYAVIDSDQCATSEFAGQVWATEYGC